MESVGPNRNEMNATNQHRTKFENLLQKHSNKHHNVKITSKICCSSVRLFSKKKMTVKPTTMIGYHNRIFAINKNNTSDDIAELSRLT